MLETINMPPGRFGNVWFHANRGRLHPTHRHRQPELNLVTQGTARYVLDDRAYEMEPGMLVWLFPAQNHRLVDMSRDFSCWIAIIDPSRLAEAAETGDIPREELIADDPLGSFCRHLEKRDARFLSELCADLADEDADSARCNAGIAYLYLSAWDAFRRAEIAQSRSLHPAIECALQLLDRDPELDAAELASDSGLSRSHFSRLFHQQIGQTLVDYRTHLRLDRVRDALRRGRQRSLLELALEAGFGSYAQFHRAVKQHCGCSPRELASGIQ